MSGITITLMIVGCCSIYLAAAWLDTKHDWKLIDWFNGNTQNPFKTNKEQQFKATINNKEQEIKDLKERIQVLEKIVTEPAYELNKKINNL
ncbi:hypothetical protein [Aliiglaciecola lipolytica]|uniref:Uncharacterized protein n=1 Tax=Aliiglaciecola lipolytica E3 TaxID=1127673 RepID=K6YDK7_9ALTE|nr:hypothetical protein [Aliiglaciecola lipolytica]GAC16277.1 hypothetical protein GLIP_3666 [Aliiglaciecola lipolytica E3]